MFKDVFKSISTEFLYPIVIFHLCSLTGTIVHLIYIIFSIPLVIKISNQTTGTRWISNILL